MIENISLYEVMGFKEAFVKRTENIFKREVTIDDVIPELKGMFRVYLN